MTHKENSVRLISQYVQVLSCPLCHSSMKVINSRSLICLKQHTFDIAKQGYVNMMTRSATQRYDDILFEARQKIIVESNVYTALHKTISEVIDERLNATRRQSIILDAGCGEGSHLQMVINESQNKKTLMGIGVDISKEGIKLAAKTYRHSMWFVGNLAQSPLADQSCPFILNIFAPANYVDFHRILKPDGLFVKVVPRSNYFKELREILFEHTDKKHYKNDKTVSLFKQQFHLLDQIPLSYSIELNQAQLLNLIRMSPLAWNLKKEQRDAMISHDISSITVDLDVLVGQKK